MPNVFRRKQIYQPIALTSLDTTLTVCLGTHGCLLFLLITGTVLQVSLERLYTLMLSFFRVSPCHLGEL